MRVTYFQVVDDTDYLLILWHHIAMDGVDRCSLNELQQAYRLQPR